MPASFVVCEYETYLPDSDGVNSIEHSIVLLTRELVVYAFILVTMEKLLKTVIGSNFKGTFEIFDREEIDLEAFWNLTSLHLKEMGKHYI